MTTLTTMVWKTPFSSPTLRLVALALAMRASNQTGICWPSQKRIAEDTGFSRRTVNAALAELEKIGYLERVPFFRSDRSRGADRLRLTLPPVLLESPCEEDSDPCESLSHPPAPVAQQELSTELNTEKKTPAAAGDLFGDDDSSPAPALLPSGHATIEEAFADWWKLFPLKKARGAAEKAFEKAITKHVSIVTLLERTRTYSILVLGKERAYLPHPATWLNQKRWDDEELLEAKPAMRLGADDWQ